MLKFKQFITEENNLTDSYNVNHTHARTKLRSIEIPPTHTSLLDTHLIAQQEGGSIPDIPLKHGHVFFHEQPSYTGFYSEHQNIDSLPPKVKTQISTKLKSGYIIHNMIHTFDPYQGSITYAHMSNPNTSQNNLYKYPHYD